MIIVHMLARFKSFLLSIITLFRRALCCFSRRRKPSYAECEILTSVNVVHTNNHNANRSHDEVCVTNANIVFIIYKSLKIFWSIYFIGRTRLEFMGWFTAYSWRTHSAISTEISPTKSHRKQWTGYWLFPGNLFILEK